MSEDLKFIRQELFEAYEMNDRILVGYALNRLDTYLKEQKEAEEQKETSPAFSNVIGSWVSVKDQSPKVMTNSIVYANKYGVYCGYYSRDGKWYDPNWNEIEVTHWMELPPKPIDAQWETAKKRQGTA